MVSEATRMTLVAPVVEVRFSELSLTPPPSPTHTSLQGPASSAPLPH